MSWAQRLKRVFSIDIETCPDCGGKLKVMNQTVARRLDLASKTAGAHQHDRAIQPNEVREFCVNQLCIVVHSDAY